MSDSNSRGPAVGSPERLPALPREYFKLGEEADELQKQLSEKKAQRRALRRAAMDAAGWKRCCRCYPSCVSDDGFCGCCLYNHVTGQQLPPLKPFFDTPAEPIEAREEEAHEVSAAQPPPDTPAQRETEKEQK